VTFVVTLSVLSGPTWWPTGTVPPDLAPLFVLEAYEAERPTRPLRPLSLVDELPVSATEYLAYVASRLRLMAQGFDDQGLPQHASDLRFMAAGMESELLPVGEPA
jgi:hypothetical protein